MSDWKNRPLYEPNLGEFRDSLRDDLAQGVGWSRTCKTCPCMGSNFYVEAAVRESYPPCKLAACPACGRTTYFGEADWPPSESPGAPRQGWAL
jgi:hypothetical protein